MTPEQRKQHDEDRKHRAEAIATLKDHAGWLALKDLLMLELKHERIAFDVKDGVPDPNWAGKMAYKAGRVDKTLDIIKTVQTAGEKKMATLETPTAYSPAHAYDPA